MSHVRFILLWQWPTLIDIEASTIYTSSKLHGGPMSHVRYINHMSDNYINYMSPAVRYWARLGLGK